VRVYSRSFSDTYFILSDSQNMLASRNMRDRFDAIMEEFQEWMKSQHKFFKTHNTLVDMGVSLYPPGKDHIALISPENGLEDLLGRALNKDETKLMGKAQSLLQWSNYLSTKTTTINYEI